MNENVDLQKVDAPRPVEAATPVPRRSRSRAILLTLALVVVALLAWRYFEGGAPGSPPTAGAGAPPQTVRDAPATTGDMPITIDALGTVTPLATITVKTQIAGKLMEVGFQEGQMVKKGDFIAQIDARPYQAALEQAQGQLAKDNALLAQAQSDLTRYETLSKQDSIALQQVTDQQFLVTQDKAAIVADQAQIDTANLNIAYCRIIAPIDGRVGLRLVDPGNYVQPSDATGLVVITEIDPISVVFSTAEDNLPQISARLNSGAKLPVQAYDRANVKLLSTGTLTTFDNQIDLTTGTFRLRSMFANPDAALFPNQFVNVRLLVDTVTGAVLAPNAAIQIGANGSFVYVVKDDAVAVQKVTTGATDSKNTVILTGLAAGDNVVIDGVDRLRDGAKVKVRNTVPAPPGATPGATPANGAAGGQRHKHGDQGAATPSPTPSATPSSPPTAEATPAPSATPAPAPSPAQ